MLAVSWPGKQFRSYVHSLMVAELTRALLQRQIETRPDDGHPGIRPGRGLHRGTRMGDDIAAFVDWVNAYARETAATANGHPAGSRGRDQPVAVSPDTRLAHRQANPEA